MAKKWIKEIELEGRNFILRFHRDSWDCLWCKGYEIKSFSIFKKEIKYREKIFEFWTPYESYIIRMGEDELEKVLKREKHGIMVKEMLDNYVEEN